MFLLLFEKYSSTPGNKRYQKPTRHIAEIKKSMINLVGLKSKATTNRLQKKITDHIISKITFGVCVIASIIHPIILMINVGYVNIILE